MSKTWRKMPKSVVCTRMMNAMVNEAVISAKSTSTSTKRRRFDDQPSGGSRRRLAVGARVLDVGEVAAELDEEREGDEHADERESACRRAPCTRVPSAPSAAETIGEQHDRSLVGEPLVHEPVRGVVAAALGHRAALEQADDRDERRVEDRHGEHEHGQQDRRTRRSPPPSSSSRARAQRRAKPSTWLPLSPMKTAARRLNRRLYGRKPRHGEARRERAGRDTGWMCAA